MSHQPCAFDAARLAVRIASNFDGRLRRVVAGLPDLASWRTAVVISADVGFRKPHAAFYHAVCASLNLPPDRVLWAGDDPENDYHGPRRAGFSALLLVRDPSRNGDVPGIANLWELAQSVGSIAGERVCGLDL